MPNVPFGACRLAPIIPDHSEVGAYSGSLEAGVYNDAAATIPKLLLMQSFGDATEAKALTAFLRQLVKATELMTSDDQRTMNR